MISLFNWNDTFLTHIPAVDEQHHRLVKLINELAEMVVSNDEVDPQLFEPVRQGILDYVNVHFSDEESLMREVGLDAHYLDRHLLEHEILINAALALGDIENEVTSQKARDFAEFLIQWLANHILDIDQSMARQIVAVQEGESPAEAYAIEANSARSVKEPLLAAMSGLFCMVSERNRELRALNRELEQRIVERTMELEQANRHLQQLSTHDDLTGLPNRRYTFMSLNQLWLERERYGDPLSILLLDVDHFKEVNDRFGHAQGDALLCSLAVQLRQSVRGSDIVCRLGGDEFIVICPRSTLAGAAKVANKILAESRPLLTATGVECWNGNISIGIVETDSTMATPEDLLQGADHAMYDAKRKGGGSVSDNSKNRDKR